MDFETAKKLLSECTRLESRDHYFGDREVYWEKDGQEIASGYFSREGRDVNVHTVYVDGTPRYSSTFSDEQADELVKLGSSVDIGRNDSTGPNRYMGA